MKNNLKQRILALTLCIAMLVTTINLDGLFNNKFHASTINDKTLEDFIGDVSNLYANTEIQEMSPNITFSINSKDTISINNEMLVEVESVKENVDISYENIENNIVKQNSEEFIAVTDIVENSDYEIISKSKESITISKIYQSKTLIVKSPFQIDTYDAIEVLSGYGNLYILKFKNENDTEKAHQKIKELDFIDYVEVDNVLSSETLSELNSEISSEEESSILIENSELTETINQTESSDKETIEETTESTETITEIEAAEEIQSSQNEVQTENTEEVESTEVSTEETINEIETKEDKVIVAVLDTGIDKNNSLFNDRIIDLGINLSTSGNGIQDDHGHGTAISSVIANNSNAHIMPIKVANNEGKGTILNLYLAIQAAIENDADIINISLTTASSDLLTSVINEATEKGIVVVASAGNNSSNVENYAPANIENVISVGALNQDYKYAEYSNYGSSIDYVAIGTDVLVETLDGQMNMTGTSISSAYVSGLYANSLENNKSFESYVYPINHNHYGKGIVSKDAIDTEKLNELLNNKETSGEEQDYINNPTENDNFINYFISQEIIDDNYIVKINYESSQFELAEHPYSWDGGKTWTNENTFKVPTNIFDKYERYILNIALKDSTEYIYYDNYYVKNEFEKPISVTLDNNGNVIPEDEINLSAYTNGGITYTYTSSNLTLAIKGTGVITDDWKYQEEFEPYIEDILAITIASGATAIDDYAFSDMDSLNKVTITGATITSIGDYAFAYNSSLASIIYGTTANTLAAGVVTIGNGAFMDCDHLTALAIGNACTDIYSAAFSGCSTLKTLTLGTALEYIGPDAFDECPLDTKLTINSKNLTDDNNVFAGNTSIVNCYFGNAVTNIPDELFKGCTNLKTVYYVASSSSTGTNQLPATVKYIGTSAFEETALTALTIKSTVGNTIESYAFRNCTKLTSITIPKTTTIIGSYAFENCGLETVSIAAGTKGTNSLSISRAAFKNCSALTTITLPVHVDDILYEAFNGCSSMITVKILNGDCYIASYANIFNDSIVIYGLADSTAQTYANNYNKTFVINSATTDSGTVGNLTWKLTFSSGTLAISGTGELPDYTSVEQTPWYKYRNLITTITTTKTVTRIGNNCFADMKALTTFTPASGLLTIGTSAFDGCTKLKNVTMVGTVTKIENRAFAGCEALDIFTTGNACTEIGSEAFYGDINLKTLTLGTALTKIGSNAFYNCPLSIKLTINSKTLNEPNDVFVNNKYLINCYFGTAVTKIPDNLFKGCSSLATVYNGTTASQLPATVTYIGTSAFEGTAIAALTLKATANNTIEDNAFKNCTSLTKFVTTATTTKIGTSAFEGCSKLKTLTLTAGAASKNTLDINSYAFKNCITLQVVTIPVHTTSLGTGFLTGCTALAQVTVNSTTCTIPNDTTSLKTIPDQAIIYVQKDSTALTYATKNNKTHAVIGDAAITGTDGNISYSLTISSGLLKITGTDMPNYSKTNPAPWHTYNTAIKTVQITKTVTNVGDYAFWDLPYLTTVQFVNTPVVTKIGTHAFADCESLTNVCLYTNSSTITNNTLPASLKEIGVYAFANCSSLEIIATGNGVTDIYDNAFSGCTSLDTLTIGTAVQNIGAGAFADSPLSAKITFNATNCLTHNNNFNNKQAAAIALGTGVTQIPSYLFYGCSSAAAITIPNKVVTIGDYAFYGCSSAASITFTATSTCTTIGKHAFDGCSSVTKVLNGTAEGQCPASTLRIEEYAFANTAIAKIHTNNKTTFVGRGAFSNCPNLVEVTIGTLVETIEQGAFDDTPLTTKITFSATNCTSYGNVFVGKETTAVVIGSSVETIPNNLFKNCENIKTVTIPASVVTIGNYAFYKCTSLATLTITEKSKCTSIGNHAFEYTALTTVLLTNMTSNHTIGDFAFSDCDSMTSFTTAKTTTKIGHGALWGNEALTTVTLTAGTVGTHSLEIGTNAFYNCDLITTITAPVHLKNIGNSAFYGCDNMERLVIKAVAGNYNIASNKNVLPQNVVLYGYTGSAAETYANTYSRTFVPFNSSGAITTISEVTDGVSYTLTDAGVLTVTYDSATNTAKNIPDFTEGKAPWYKYRELIKSIVINKAITEVGDYAFYGLYNATTVTFSNGSVCTRIGTSAFEDCISLSNVKYYNTSNQIQTVTTIEPYAFFNCYSLTTLNLTDKVTSIGYMAFYCSKLETIKINNKTCILDENFVDEDTIIYGYTDSTTKTYCDDNGNTFIPISGVTTDTGTIGDLTWTLTFSSGALVISGKGDMPDFDNEEAPWYKYRGIIKTITIKSGVTSIGNWAFCDLNKVTYTIFNDTQTCLSIGDYAFYNCTSMKNIGTKNTDNLIPATVTEIGVSAFDNCSSLTSINTQGGVKTIGDYAFYDCSSMTKVTLGVNVETIGMNPFYGCDKLTTISYCPVNLKNYDTSHGIFEDLTSITTVAVHQNTRSIPDRIFAGCENITKVTFNNAWNDDGSVKAYSQVTSIGNAAFKDCKALAYFYHNKNNFTDLPFLTSIGESAFENCESMQRFYLPSDLKTVGLNAYKNAGNGSTIVYVKSRLLDNFDNAKELIENNEEPYTVYFSGNTKIKEININANVQYIPDYMFYNCTNVSKFSGGGTGLVTVGDYAFCGCSSYQSTAALKTFYSAKLKNVGIDAFRFGGYQDFEDITNQEYADVTINHHIYKVNEDTYYEDGLAEVVVEISSTTSEKIKGNDYLIVIDTTGSMDNNADGRAADASNSKMTHAKAALSEFVNMITADNVNYTNEEDKNRIAICNFTSLGYLYQDFTSDNATLLSKVAAEKSGATGTTLSTTDGSGTNYVAGLEAAICAIAGRKTQNDRDVYVIFISDGGANVNQTLIEPRSKILCGMTNGVWAIGIAVESSGNESFDYLQLVGESANMNFLEDYTKDMPASGLAKEFTEFLDSVRYQSLSSAINADLNSTINTSRWEFYNGSFPSKHETEYEIHEMNKSGSTAYVNDIPFVYGKDENDNCQMIYHYFVRVKPAIRLQYRGTFTAVPNSYLTYENSSKFFSGETFIKNTENPLQLDWRYYAINYYGNGSTSGAYSYNRKLTNENLTIKNNYFTKTGYTFKNWNTKSNGSGTAYSQGSVYGTNSDLTLYAQWTANSNTKYVVNHYLMNVTGNGYTLTNTDNKTGTSDSILTVANLKRTYTGFTYEGGKGTTLATYIKPDKFDLTTTVLADGTRVINLYYSRNQYTVALNKGTGINTLSGAGTYYYNSSVTINSTLLNNYIWKNWTGTGIDSSNNQKYTFNMPASNVTLTANAVLNNVNYKVNHYLMNTSGTGYDLKDAETFNGTPETQITISNLQKSYTGFTFKGGKGTNAATSVIPSTLDTTTTILADGTRVINLYYTRNQYTVTLNKGTGISEVVGAGKYYYGQTVNIKAIVATNTVQYTYGWINWTGDYSSSNKEYSFTMPTNNVSMIANGTQTLNKYNQIVEVRYENADGSFTEYENVINASYNYGTKIEWSRPADAIYKAASITSYTVTGTKTTQVTVYRNTYTVTIEKGEGINTITGADSYRAGQSVTINATVLTGYTWSKWTGESTQTTQSYKFEMPTHNVTYKANATINSYKLTVNPNGGMWNGSTSNSTFTLNYKTTKEITSPTRIGYTFNNWTLSGTGSTLNGTIFTMGYANTTLTANWTANPDTKYVVNHYLKNLEDSNYTLENTEQLKGTTDSILTIGSLRKTFDGFTYEGGTTLNTLPTVKPSSFETTTTILPDGSRVINLYYSRNKYVVTYIDVVDSTSGKELKVTTEQAYYGKLVNGSDKGNNREDNAYYYGYYLDSTTQIKVGVSGATVYRIFKLRTIDVKGTVNWIDKSNKHKTRPQDVSVYLFRGTDQIDIQDSGLTGNDNNAFSFLSLPKYNPENGEAYVYTVSQSKIESLTNPEDTYTTKVDDSGFNFTNSLGNFNVIPDLPPVDPPEIVESYEIHGTIKWEDYKNKLGYRPSSVELVLYQNGQIYTSGEYKITSDKHEYDFSFTNLPKYDSELNRYNYTVAEIVKSKALSWDENINDYVEIDAYIITSSGYDFTNTLVEPIGIKVKPDTTNTLTFNIDFNENVDWKFEEKKSSDVISLVTLKRLYSETENGTTTYYEHFDGHEYNIVVNEKGVTISNIPSGKYEVTQSNDNTFILERLKLQTTELITISNENGKWYITIPEVDKNQTGVITLKLDSDLFNGYDDCHFSYTIFSTKKK